MPEQDPKIRAKNFDEVALGYGPEDAVAEAERCLNCKIPQCRKGCPVQVDIPAFISKIKEKDFDILLTVGAGNIDTLYDPIMNWLGSN